MPSVVETISPEARLGLRPLSTHLLAAALTYASSDAALPLLKNGSSHWGATLDEWILQVGEIEIIEMSTAVEQESRRRLAAFLNSVEAYRDYPYQRTLTETAAAARVGSSQLLELPANGTDDETAILVVPSLIKRA